jgi:hypothetical protein
VKVFLSRLPHLFTPINSAYATTSPASSSTSVASPSSTSLFPASQLHVSANPQNASSWNPVNNGVKSFAGSKTTVTAALPTSLFNQSSTRPIPASTISSSTSTNTTTSSNIINLSQSLSSSFPSSSSVATTFSSKPNPIVETKPIFSSSSSTSDILHNISQMNNALVLEKYSNPEKLKDLNSFEKKLEVSNFWNQRLSVSVFLYRVSIPFASLSIFSRWEMALRNFLNFLKMVGNLF